MVVGRVSRSWDAAKDVRRAETARVILVECIRTGF
jgi:hypothetical protein